MAALTLAVGCGKQSRVLQGALTLSGQPATLAKGAQAQVTATLTQGGQSADVTTTATWASSDTAIATVSAGLVTGVAEGDVNISATVGSLTASVPLHIGPAIVPTPTPTSLVLTAPQTTLAKGSTVQVTATAKMSDGSEQDVTQQATWSTTSGAVLSVDNGGLALAQAPGSATIGATYSGVSAHLDFTVTPPVLRAISVTPSPAVLTAGNSLQLSASGLYSDGSRASVTAVAQWTTADNVVATVGAAGLLLGINAGATTAKAAIGEVTATVPVTVSAALPTAIQLAPANPALVVGTTLAFSAQAVFADGTHFDVTTQAAWSSDDLAAATVSDQAGSKGTATAVAAGAAHISATFAGVTGSTTLTVNAATLTEISIDPTDPTIAAGTTVQLTATGIFDNGTRQDLTTQVTWTSSDPSVTVDASGLATGASPGSSTVTASFAGVDSSVLVTVTNATLNSIDITPPDATIPVLTTLQYTATGTFSDGNVQDITAQVAWGSSDSSVAIVSSAPGSMGLAKGLTVGDVTVTASSGSIVGTTTLAVVQATLQSIAIVPASPSIPLGTTLQLQAQGTYDNGTVQDLTGQVTWLSSDTNVLDVSNAAGSAGLATPLSIGPSTVTAVLGTVSGQTVATVTDAALQIITITPSTATVPVKYDIWLHASGSYSDGSVRDITRLVTWTSSNTSIATVSNTSPIWGQVDGNSPGTVTITAELSGQKGTAQVTVTNAKLRTIVVSPATSTLAPKQTEQLTAQGTFSDGFQMDLTRQLKWSSSKQAVASVSNGGTSRGLVTAKSPGTTTITASKQGVSGKATVTVQ